jgi:hypothetical protein
MNKDAVIDNVPLLRLHCGCKGRASGSTGEGPTERVTAWRDLLYQEYKKVLRSWRLRVGTAKSRYF